MPDSPSAAPDERRYLTWNDDRFRVVSLVLPLRCMRPMFGVSVAQFALAAARLEDFILEDNLESGQRNRSWALGAVIARYGDCAIEIDDIISIARWAADWASAPTAPVRGPPDGPPIPEKLFA